MGFHQISKAPESFGFYEFLRIPFGLKIAAHVFQWLMDTICCGSESVFGYIDVILVASRDSAEHKIHLHQLLNTFRNMA